MQCLSTTQKSDVTVLQLLYSFLSSLVLWQMERAHGKLKT